MRRVVWCAVALALCLAGCARQVRPAPQGEVEAGLLFPFGAPTVEVRKDEQLFAAAPVGSQPMPAYPPQLLESGLDARRVCVEIIVQADGQVASARRNNEAGECRFGEVEPAFVDSAVDTIRGWQFFGAQICRFPAHVEANDGCEGEGVEIEPIPMRLTYVFAFSVVDGEAQVRRLP